MQLQVNSVLKAQRKSICSTSLNNIASRKAIEKSESIFGMSIKTQQSGLLLQLRVACPIKCLVLRLLKKRHNNVALK